jgi:hypothetical protein
MEKSDKDLLEDLMQIRPKWRLEYSIFQKYYGHFGLAYSDFDLNKWSRVHPRFESHSGCIVDLGCLGWNKDFNDPRSDNWAGYFFGKKRVIGVDPQESPNPHAEIFRGFVADFNGRGRLVNQGVGASLISDPCGEFEVLTFREFKKRFNVTEIAILKINIEGSEWGLIESLDASDLENVDQICISFHDFLRLTPDLNNLLARFWLFTPMSKRTEQCIHKLKSLGYRSLDLGIYGWRIFLREK